MTISVDKIADNEHFKSTYKHHIIIYNTHNGYGTIILYYIQNKIRGLMNEKN